MASVAYVDPGNFATNIQGGAEYGYLLLWVIVASNLMAMLIQSLSAKLGIATGRNLAELCRDEFSRPVVWGMWIVSELVAMATDLAEFLLARITDDEQAARECAKIYPPPWDMYDRGHSAKVQADAPHFRHVVDLDQDQVALGEVEWLGDAIEHVSRHDPARVLAECEAKRRIIADLGPPYWKAGGSSSPYDAALRALALPYASHPDYREEWRP